MSHSGGHASDHYSGGSHYSGSAGHSGHGHGGFGHHGGDHHFHGITHSLHAPHGTLSADMLGAAAYVSAGYIGHHDLGHFSHINIADALTVAIVVSAAESFGGVHGQSEAIHGYSEITMADLPGFAGWPDSNSDPGKPAVLRKINKPGATRSSTSLEFTQYFHGNCDPMAEIERLALKQYKALRIKPNEMDASCLEINKTVPWITSNMPLTDPDNKYNKPNGWYEGVQGTTHIWRRFYQLRPSMNWLFGQPKFDIWRTFLVVTGVTWYYSSTGDYETRISFMVYSKPFNKRSGVLTYDWEWIEKHFFLAERLMQGGVTYVKDHPAPRASIAARKAIEPERYEPVVPPRIPAPSSVPGGVMPVSPTAPGIDEDDPRLKEIVDEAVRRKMGDPDIAADADSE